jgi:hypothetical protein
VTIVHALHDERDRFVAFGEREERPLTQPAPMKRNAMLSLVARSGLRLEKTHVA